MANYDSAEPISGSISSLLFTSVTKGNTGIPGSNMISFQPTVITSSVAGGTALVPIYRSLVGAQYVYTTGSPAPGFTFTSIIGYR